GEPPRTSICSPAASPPLRSRSSIARVKGRDGPSRSIAPPCAVLRAGGRTFSAAAECAEGGRANFIPQIQGWLLLILAAAAVARRICALSPAGVTKPATCIAAGRRRKVSWLATTGGATLLSPLARPTGGGGGRASLLRTILPLVGAGVYLTDVRPALKEYGKRPRG